MQMTMKKVKSTAVYGSIICFLCSLCMSCSSLSVENQTYTARYDATAVNYIYCNTKMSCDIVLEPNEMILDCVVSPADVYKVKTAVSQEYNNTVCHVILTRLKQSFHDGTLIITTDRRTYRLVLLSNSYENHMNIYKWSYKTSK